MEKKEKREREKKSKKKEKKRGRVPRVSSNKGEVNILRGEKYFNFKNPF
jgi:hypothetical protein